MLLFFAQVFFIQKRRIFTKKKRKKKPKIPKTTGGLLYTVTDVKDLYEWEKEHCDAHPLFQLVPEKELEGDPAVSLALNSTEESKKVDREGREKHIAVFRRVLRASPSKID